MPDLLPTPPAPAADLDVLLKLLRDRLTPAPELLTRETFAALLGIGTSTFDKLRETGEIGPQPSGSRG